jgi:hypothetical protein
MKTLDFVSTSCFIFLFFILFVIYQLAFYDNIINRHHGHVSGWVVCFFIAILGQAILVSAEYDYFKKWKSTLHGKEV